LRPLLSASKTVGSILKKGDVVVFESTVYPGCTEDDCVPILEQESGLTFPADFKVGYSPERINPGDKEHTLTKITKVVSGCDAETLEWVAKVYGSIIEAGIYKAASIKVAEAAKIIENTQRDLNISLMNELSMIFDRMNINTQDVLEAAATKWNFLRFSPGLVGGHCIGVDPYYLTYKAKSIGIDPQVILSGRFINDGMAGYVAQKTVQKLAKLGKSLADCRVLVMGITFKENVSDIRNSKVVDLVKSLESFSLQVDVVDPFAKAPELKKEYGLTLAPEPQNHYDAVVLAVPHSPYNSMDEHAFKALLKPDGVVIDIKGVLNKKLKNTPYWSL
jgi:UDP-N-acetyl-D-galactosamine dehydrogenase